jgi:hypothetical protein
MSKEDVIQIEVLDDGTIKATTDPISSANHLSADKFFRLLQERAGGATVRNKRSNTHTHVHEGEKEHSHG